MKLKTISVTVTYNTGNYTSLRLGGEWEVAQNETLDEALKNGKEELDEAFRKMHISDEQVVKEVASNPIVQQLNKEFDLEPLFITKEHPKYDAIMQRARQGVTLLQMKQKGYTFADDVANEIKLANTLYEQVSK